MHLLAIRLTRYDLSGYVGIKQNTNLNKTKFTVESRYAEEATHGKIFSAVLSQFYWVISTRDEVEPLQMQMRYLWMDISLQIEEAQQRRYCASLLKTQGTAEVQVTFPKTICAQEVKCLTRYVAK